jgi:putative aminopeptidase FrvX
MAAISINTSALLEFLVGLLNTPSPTGMTEKAVDYCEQAFASFGLPMRRTHKGALVIEWPGEAATAPRALTAHVDTLGGMVKDVKGNGRLKLTKIGGFAWNTVEGEGCTVFTHTGQTVRGSLLVTKASSHIFGNETGDMKRDDDGVEVRLDARTTTAGETRALGIGVGDFVAFDPRIEIGSAGFVRSRHLDDKAAVACLYAAVQSLLEAGLKPTQRATLHISNYEEVGHGAASGFPPDLVELLSLDMAAVGPGQASSEFAACICVKDSGGPYHAAMNRKLRALAEAANIPHTVDIYPYYGSDGEAYWRAGGDVQVGLLGPGVEASHNYERTHTESLVYTSQLIGEYLRS